ncbi:hypothetical protein FRB91_007297 [Serendipita sp. 411]|nr:hypothetical protein FRB91_007297 [Serendipita sp. 411]
MADSYSHKTLVGDSIRSGDKSGVPSPAASLKRTNSSGGGGPIDMEPSTTTNNLGEAKLVENQDPTKPVERKDRYLHGKQLVFVHIGLLTVVFLAALDQSIVSTAIPRISSEFNALKRISWIVSAFFLTQAGLLLFWGRVLRIVSTKYVYLIAVVIFETGSLLCAVAPSMNVLILGRAIQGVGGGGGIISGLTLVTEIAVLSVRPILMATFGATFGLAAAFGPLIGGEFTDKATWRWCFYVNLPLGGFAIASAGFLLPVHPPIGASEHGPRPPLLKQWLNLDWIGAILSLGMVTTLILPLQWGGIEREWNDRLVIILFVISGILFIAFGFWEYRQGSDKALMPISMLLNRTQLAGGFAMFFFMATHLNAIYHIPFYYQSKGRSASQSGVDLLPYVLAMVVGSLGSGAIAKRTGRYWPFLMVGPVVAASASGVMFTITAHTKSSTLIGYQIWLGLGVGIVFQLPLLAIQAEWANRPDIIPMATSLQMFFQYLGAVCGTSLTGAIFGNELHRALLDSQITIPEDVIKAVRASVTVVFRLDQALQQPVIDAYVKGLDATFLFGAPAMAVAMACCLFVRNWNMHERGKLAIKELELQEGLRVEREEKKMAEMEHVSVVAANASGGATPTTPSPPHDGKEAKSLNGVV